MIITGATTLFWAEPEGRNPKLDFIKIGKCDIAIDPSILCLRIHEKDVAKLKLQKEHAEQELGKARKSSTRMYDLYAEGIIKTTKDLAQKMKPYEDRIVQLTGEIAHVLERLTLLENEDLARESVIREAIRLGELWDEFTYDERSRILQSLVSEVVVSETDVQIRVSVLPAFHPDKSMERGMHPQGFMAATSMIRDG